LREAAGSEPETASSTAAASATVRAKAPPVSRLRNNGTMPSRLVNPRVGRMPTRLVWEAGPRIEFPVSVPSPAAPKLAATAAAVPPLEPAGTRSSA
jgi:hypothetical protein